MYTLEQNLAIERTLADYIKNLTERATPVETINLDEYNVYPDDDGYDLPRNPFSKV